LWRRSVTAKASVVNRISISSIIELLFFRCFPCSWPVDRGVGTLHVQRGENVLVQRETVVMIVWKFPGTRTTAGRTCARATSRSATPSRTSALTRASAAKRTTPTTCRWSSSAWIDRTMVSSWSKHRLGLYRAEI
ncbi:hypothetical protein ANCCAN_15833, partial [Ancylostoma caninum]